MKIADIQGNQPLRVLFMRLQLKGRLPPSLILEGIAGCGRRSLALAIAQAHLCNNPQLGDSCGDCESCKLMHTQGHPDCTLMPHDSESKDIPVAQIRERVVQEASDSALMGNGRVFIIPGLERLRQEASNALLKILEEPPAGTMIICTCTQRESVLPTIRSRCQIYRMNPLQQSEITTVLRLQGIDAADAQRLAQNTHGSHRGLATSEQDTSSAPLAELQSIVYDGYDSELISRIYNQLPQSVPKHIDMTLAAYQRRICQQWLGELLYIIRERMRKNCNVDDVEIIKRIVVQQHDVARNIDPRLVLEGVALLG
ncbi:MAG: DNA polymerase III subunit delta' [Planctomycetes bacterium]|nr:DNA polymerase III subunit delta' [Planctomycetota bacterium]